MTTLPDEIKQLIKKLIVEAVNSGLQGVSNTRAILQILHNHNRAYFAQLHPRLVVVHRRNRDRIGLITHEVHSLFDDIVDVGFSWSAIEGICTDVEPEDIEQTQLLQIEAKGALGKVCDSNEPQMASMAASHTNFVLRICSEEVEHEGNDKYTMDGKLSMAKLKVHQPAMHDAATIGLKWLVIPRDIIQEFVELPDLIQAMANAKLTRGESQPQIILRTHNLIVAEQQAKGAATFTNIKARILSSKPTFPQVVPFMFELALKHSGGKDGHILKGWVNYIRSCRVPANVFVEPEVWEILSEENPKCGLLSLIRWSVLLNAFINKNVQIGDCKKVFSKEQLPKTAAAEKLMASLGGLVPTGWIETQDVKTMIWRARMNMAIVAVGLKTGKHVKKMESIEAVAHDFILQLRELTKMDIKSDFEAHAHAEADESKDKPKEVGYVMREFGEDGLMNDATQLLQEKGFAVGQLIVRKGDGFIAKIDSVHGMNVVMMVEGQPTTNIAIHDFMMASWSAHVPKPEPIIVDANGSTYASDAPEFVQASLQASIIQDLFKLTQREKEFLFPGEETLIIQLKPNKAVFAKCNVGKGSLKLIPSSTSIKYVPYSTKFPTNFILVKVKSVVDGAFIVSPFTSSQGFIAPFWFVQYQRDDDEVANMHFVDHCSAAGNVIPILVNKVAIKAGDRLVIEKHAEPKAKTASEPKVNSASPAEAKAKAKAKAASKPRVAKVKSKAKGEPKVKAARGKSSEPEPKKARAMKA